MVEDEQTVCEVDLIQAAIAGDIQAIRSVLETTDVNVADDDG